MFSYIFLLYCFCVCVDMSDMSVVGWHQGFKHPSVSAHVGKYRDVIGITAGKGSGCTALHHKGVYFPAHREKPAEANDGTRTLVIKPLCSGPL